jgi:hypothetical protein
MESARKASDCHKLRTGKGLKVTAQAVMGDEQYESEEEEQKPRRSSCPVGIPSKPPIDNYDAVDALFARAFPGIQLNADRVAAQEGQQHQQPSRPHPHSHRRNYSDPFSPAVGGGYAPHFQQHAPVLAPMLGPAQVHAHTPAHPPSPISSIASASPAGSVPYPPPPSAHGADGFHTGLRTPHSMSPPEVRGQSPHMAAGMVAAAAAAYGGNGSEGQELYFSYNVNHNGANLNGGNFDGGHLDDEDVLERDLRELRGLCNIGNGGGVDELCRFLNQSLPSTLEEFRFPAFEPAQAPAYTPAQHPSDGLSLIDPDILSASALTVTATDGVDGAGIANPPANDANGAAETPSELWTSWLNFDGDAAPALGVEV